MSTPTKHEDSTDTEPVDPWAELKRVASTFRYRAEATGDPEMRGVATALDALRGEKTRQAVVKAGIAALKKIDEPLTIRAQADALLEAVKESIARHGDDPQRVAADIVTALIKFGELRARATRYPKFYDSFDEHEAAIADVAWEIHDQGRNELRTPRRIVIRAMYALGDARAEKLFAESIPGK